ncbi:MAG: hypothetical protein ACREB9_08460, partial [Thermoplasmata archaeon]
MAEGAGPASQRLALRLDAQRRSNFLARTFRSAAAGRLAPIHGRDPLFVNGSSWRGSILNSLPPDLVRPGVAPDRLEERRGWRSQEGLI